MGFIILGQVEYLRFVPKDKTSSVVACFITAILEAIMVIGIMFYQKKQNIGNVSRENYIDFQNEMASRPR